MSALRRLGAQGPAVGPIGLGCVGMSSELYGPRERGESIATVQRAVELGVTLFDTSDVYGSGHNEELLGTALAGLRHEITLATKFGALRLPGGGYRVDGTPTHVRAACEASLRRLQTDHIDLYYQHRVDPDTPIEDTVGAMAALVSEGKVRFLGLSECSAATLRRAHAVHPISAVQLEYSLFAREPEAELVPACRQLGVGIVAYSPLGRGILTGTIDDLGPLGDGDYRRIDPRYAGANLAANLQLVRQIRAQAQQRGCTAGQLALAWLLGAGPDVVPIPGTARRHHLEENVAATTVELTGAEVDGLRALVPADAVAGLRYPPGELARLGL